MSDEAMPHGHSGHETEYEHEDLGTRGIFAFMIGLAVSGLIIYFIIVGMYRFLDQYEQSHATAASPLGSSLSAASRVVTQADMDEAFKNNGAPMLETNERTELRSFLTDQEDQLNSYAWIDEKAGVARIPIERAMQLIVERKIPVYPQGNAEAGAAESKKTPAAKQ